MLEGADRKHIVGGPTATHEALAVQHCAFRKRKCLRKRRRRLPLSTRLVVHIHAAHRPVVPATNMVQLQQRMSREQ